MSDTGRVTAADAAELRLELAVGVRRVMASGWAFEEGGEWDGDDMQRFAVEVTAEMERHLNREIERRTPSPAPVEREPDAPAADLEGP